jgi:CRP-like cAMP-binding protein
MNREQDMVHPLLEQLPPELLDSMAQRIQKRHYPKASIIFHQGEQPRGLYFIDTGLLQFGIDSPAGHSTCIGIAKQGFYLGDCEILAAKPHFSRATAFTDCTISLLPREDFEQAMRDSTSFATAVAQRLAKSLHLVQMVQMARHQYSAEQNIAGIILYLARHFGTLFSDGRYRVDLELSQDQLADMAGVTRQSIHKPLQAWKAAGWIDYRYGNLVVQDINALLALLSPL